MKAYIQVVGLWKWQVSYHVTDVSNYLCYRDDDGDCGHGNNNNSIIQLDSFIRVLAISKAPITGKN